MSEERSGGVELAKAPPAQDQSQEPPEDPARPAGPGDGAGAARTASAAAYTPGDDDPRPRARRFWSARRVPA
ncbi:hypothetical protein RKE29_29250, partial [Streptomyces sp. B1866]|nr:hypothetical protein [Streptomyces sp. B1866]